MHLTTDHFTSFSIITFLDFTNDLKEESTYY